VPIGKSIRESPDISHHFESEKMSEYSTPDPHHRSPKRRRTESPADGTPQYDGAEGATALQYAYDDELPSDAEKAFPTPEEDGTAAKRRKIDRPTTLNYVPHMILRGHKRGVAAVKFSPDGRWIASCCG